MPEPTVNPWENPFAGFWGTSLMHPDFREKYLAYQKAGGGLGYAAWANEWNRTGQPPAPPTAITARTKGLMKTPEFAEQEKVRLQGGISGLERRKVEEALKQVRGEDLTKGLPAPNGITEWYDASGTKYIWNGLEYIKAGFDSTKIYQPQPTGYPQPTEGIPTDPYGRTATWDTDNAEWKYPPDWGTDPATQVSGYISPYEQKRLGIEQERIAQERSASQAQQRASEEMQEQQIAWQREQQQLQLEAQKQARLAELRANPASWLEYASYAGETPTIQPWMMPLMPQQYNQSQAGQALPGYSQTEAKMNLPELTTPSAQYWSRTTPSARQQYIGYEQARTGATPSDIEWRLWSGAPPSGSYRGARRLRY